MTVKSRKSSASWVDPDDAPELTDEVLERAELTVGGRRVSPATFAKAAKAAVNEQARRIGRPRSVRPKVSTTIRFDAELLLAIKATGPGWQTRVNDALRADMKAGRLKAR